MAKAGVRSIGRSTLMRSRLRSKKRKRLSASRWRIQFTGIWSAMFLSAFSLAEESIRRHSSHWPQDIRAPNCRPSAFLWTIRSSTKETLPRGPQSISERNISIGVSIPRLRDTSCTTFSIGPICRASTVSIPSAWQSTRTTAA